MLETAVTYMQLDRAAAKLRTLREQAIDAGRLETISRQRLEEGVDSKADATRSSLIAARLRLRVAEAQGNADLLRQRLGQLTGLEPAELETDSTSLLPPPEIDQRADLAARAVANSPEVKVAMEKARAAQLRAKSEHFATYPSVDLVGNYGLFTEYNNLDLLFPAGKFSRHNATFGISIRMPFVNATQRSRASAADAEALKAQKMAQVTREQVANDTLRLQRTVQQLEAARDVAKLEQELAESNVIAAQTKVESGNGTIKDRENARIEAGDKQAALLDAQFQLDRARLELLRATGDLEAWALP